MEKSDGEKDDPRYYPLFPSLCVSVDLHQFCNHPNSSMTEALLGNVTP